MNWRTFVPSELDIGAEDPLPEDVHSIDEAKFILGKEGIEAVYTDLEKPRVMQVIGFAMVMRPRFSAARLSYSHTNFIPRIGRHDTEIHS